MIWPICIPSKGRPHCRTWRLLRKARLKAIVFVEPQDEAAYREAGVQWLKILPRNDAGLAYARNFIREYVVWRDEWTWVIDDDIRHFLALFRTPHGPVTKPARPSVALGTVQNLLKTHDQASIMGMQFLGKTRSAGAPVSIQRPVRYAVALGGRRVENFVYDAEAVPFEDVDFCYAATRQGALIVRHNMVATEPHFRGEAGGLPFAVRDLDYRRERIAYLKQKWPGVVREEETTTGRPRVEAVWRWSLPHEIVATP